MLLKEMVIDENNMGFIPSIGVSFELNETAKEIIDLIKQDKTKEEIVNILSQKYNKEWREVYIDVQDFFQKLKVYGLVQ